MVLLGGRLGIAIIENGKPVPAKSLPPVVTGAGSHEGGGGDIDNIPVGACPLAFARAGSSEGRDIDFVM